MAIDAISVSTLSKEKINNCFLFLIIPTDIRLDAFPVYLEAAKNGNANDMRKEIKKFCMIHNKERFICHCQLIQSMRAHRLHGLWCILIVGSKNYDEFIFSKKQIEAELEEYFQLNNTK